MSSSYAVIFPGQGSQSTGMLSELAEQHAEVGDTFQQASNALGFDLWQLVANGPEEKLNQTENTQPALLSASVAIWKILEKQTGRTSGLLAGHSLGEYSALVCAGALDFSDAVKLVAKRGKYMQQAVAAGEGSMAAILGLEDEDIIRICESISADKIVSAANFNSPGQVVIAGHADAVEEAVAAAKEAGAKRSVILPVSVPSHCLLMQSAAEKLKQDLESVNIQIPRIPVLHNVDAKPKDTVEGIRKALVEQLYKPVQWTACVQAIKHADYSLLVECGPGKVLTGLVKRIDRSLTCIASENSTALGKLIDTLNNEGES